MFCRFLCGTLPAGRKETFEISFAVRLIFCSECRTAVAGVNFFLQRLVFTQLEIYITESIRDDGAASRFAVFLQTFRRHAVLKTAVAALQQYCIIK